MKNLCHKGKRKKQKTRGKFMIGTNIKKDRKTCKNGKILDIGNQIQWYPVEEKVKDAW